MIRYTLMLAIISIMLASACINADNDAASAGNPGNMATAEATDTEKPETAATEKEDTVCSNDYYPITPSSSRKYKVTGDVPGNYVMTQTVPKEGTFVEVRKFTSGTDVKVNWICTDEGLRTAEYNNTVNFTTVKSNMETLESTGITIPKEWSVGKTWDSEYKVKVNIDAGTVSASASGTIAIDSKIVSMDDAINVNGKELTAAKVESVLKMNLSMSGRKIPSNDIKLTNWYSKDVGLVRQSESSKLGKSEIEYIGLE